MNKNIIIVLLISGVMLLNPLLSFASNTQTGKDTGQTKELHKKKSAPDTETDKPDKIQLKQDKKLQKMAPLQVRMPVYKPPLRGAPVGRVGGGTRGTGDELYTLFAIAPDHIGLTTKGQPSLFWFLSKKSRYPVELTIIEEKAVEPMFEMRITPPVPIGMHRFRLADYGISLSLGSRYEWFVSIVVDPNHRSKDILSGGRIEYISLPDSLASKVSQVPNAELPFIYAEDGLWYDAYEAISDLISNAHQDMSYKDQRAALLRQIGLEEIAKTDLQ